MGSISSSYMGIFRVSMSFQKERLLGMLLVHLTDCTCSFDQLAPSANIG
jgi:hypothetical protein